MHTGNLQFLLSKKEEIKIDQRKVELKGLIQLKEIILSFYFTVL